MLSLIDPTTVPPGGFRYVQKETNTTITAPSLSELLGKVMDHRLGNHLPIPLEWKQEVEQQLCEQMPTGTCRHLAGTRDIPLPPVHRPLSVAEAISGAKIIGAWLFRGFEKVSQELADTRSKICVGCPFNQPGDGCTTCASNAMREAIEGVIGGSRSIAHDSLHTCQVCGCALKVGVWAPLDLLAKHTDPKELDRAPEWCWKRMQPG